MDKWTRLTEFFACGLLVLPTTLGIGLDSFEVFAVALSLMVLLLIMVSVGAPSVAAPSRNDEGPDRHPD